MLTFLKDIVELFLFIPDYILFAVETAFNLFMEALQGIVILAAELVPLPAVPSAPEWVSEINWFFPIGAIITVGTPILLGYIAFLGVRWILVKVGEL